MINLIIAVVIAFMLGYMLSNRKSDITIVPKKIEKTKDLPNFFDDRAGKQGPLGDDYPGWMCPSALPICDRESGCMVGCGPCSPLCSGEGNPCNITAPVPSPAWQPQSASTVQYRLRTGNYVPAYCPQGAFALQKAPKCGNLGDVRDSREPKQVTCYTSKHPL